MKSSTRLLQVLREPKNLITIAGIVVAVVSAIIDIGGPSYDLMLSGMVFLLAAISVSQVIADYELTKRWEQLDKLEALQYKTTERISTMITPFLQKRSASAEQIRQRLLKSRDALIIGRTLSLVCQQTDHWQELLDNGCYLRLVMLNPDSPLANTASAWNSVVLRANLDRLKELRPKPSSGGRIEIRLIDSLLHQGFAVADHGAPNSEIIVELVPYKCGNLSRPIFFVHRDIDPTWYEFFWRTCDRIWNESIPV